MALADARRMYVVDCSTQGIAKNIMVLLLHIMKS